MFDGKVFNVVIFSNSFSATYRVHSGLMAHALGIFFSEHHEDDGSLDYSIRAHLAIRSHVL